MTKIRTVVVDDEPMARERIIGMLNMEKDIEVVGEYSDSSEHLERRRAGDLGKRLMALVQDIKPEPQKLDRLVIKSGGRVFFLRTQEIDWIEAAGNYVKLHLGDDSHLFRETMNNMEGRLDLQRFVRIHRSRIVNTDRIKEMQPWFNGEYVVVLQNGIQLTLSRGYRGKLQERLGKGF